MITSRGTFSRVIQPIFSSNGSAAYLSDPANLVDCSPSTSCALQWTSGLQSSAVYVHLPWRMVPAPTTECRVFALLGLVGIPAGTRLYLYGGATAAASTLLSAAEVVQLPDGTFGAWLIRATGEGWTHEYFAWRVYNDDGAGSPIASSAIVYIGELYATPAWDWPLGRMEIKVQIPQLLNRASSGAGRTVKRDPYRTAELTITPQDWRTAMCGTDSLLAMLYDLAGQDCVAIVPRPQLRGGVAPDAEAYQANSFLAALTDAGGLAAEAAVDRYPLTLSFEAML